MKNIKKIFPLKICKKKFMMRHYNVIKFEKRIIKIIPFQI